MFSVVVLISGAGSNLRALLDAQTQADYPARVVAVGSERDAPGLAYADDYGIDRFVTPWQGSEHRERWGQSLSVDLQQWRPDLIVLSGFMKLLPATVVTDWAPNIINTHPAYLPEFPGAHAVRDALTAGARRTGASVIQVDGGVDTGPILRQERVTIHPEDTEDSLHERIKLVERELLIDTVARIARHEIILNTQGDT